MDTAQTRWTVRHKQHIRQEVCFFENRLPASFYNPAQPPVAPRVADKADTADTENPLRRKRYLGDTGLLVSHAFDENELLEDEVYKEPFLNGMAAARKCGRLFLRRGGGEMGNTLIFRTNSL